LASTADMMTTHKFRSVLSKIQVELDVLKACIDEFDQQEKVSLDIGQNETNDANDVQQPQQNRTDTAIQEADVQLDVSKPHAIIHEEPQLIESTPSQKKSVQWSTNILFREHTFTDLHVAKMGGQTP